MPVPGRPSGLTSEAHAHALDARDPLAALRDRFNIQSDMIYRDGTLLIFWGSRANAIYRRSGRGLVMAGADASYQSISGEWEGRTLLAAEPVCIGSVTVNVLPWPGSDSTSMRPPCASTMRREI